MTPENDLPDPLARPSATDDLLGDMASLTGLFNPEVIWQQEERLNDLEQQDARTPAAPADSAA